MGGERMSAAEFRALPQQTKAPVGPQAVKGNSMFALGRMPTGVMNKTEERFLEEWIKPRILTGDVTWWAFEGIKLRLADSTFFTADFAVMNRERAIDIIDVKGAAHLVAEDARVKIKVAAEHFPFRFHLAWPMGGTTARTRGWHVEQVGRK
jgi:hypothetical protein